MKQKSESGQGLVEYALILILIALVVIVALALIGPTLVSAYQNVIQNIPSP